MRSEELEQAVREALMEFGVEALASGLDGTPNWTLGVASCLADLGRKQGCKVCVSGLVGDDREWLYDMVWYKEFGEKKDDIRLKSVPFVMECEWSRSTYDIAEDFEKLLLANADLRLMVCWMHRDNRAAMQEYFYSSVKGFDQGRTGDRFLVAILDYETDAFEFETYVK